MTSLGTLVLPCLTFPATAQRSLWLVARRWSWWRQAAAASRQGAVRGRRVRGRAHPAGRDQGHGGAGRGRGPGGRAAHRGLSRGGAVRAGAAAGEEGRGAGACCAMHYTAVPALAVLQLNG